MSRRELTAYVTVIVLLAVTSLLLATTVRVDTFDRPGVSLMLPGEIGEWAGRRELYCHAEACGALHRFAETNIPGSCPDCGGPLKAMSRVEQDVLGVDTEFVKSLYTHPSGSEAHMTLVLSNRQRNSIHRPQRCLTAQGFTIVRDHLMNVESDSGRGPQMMALDITRPLRAGPGAPIWEGTFLYWFVGQGRQTPHHGTRMFWLAWDRIVHHIGHRWAYVSIQTSEPGDSELLDGFLQSMTREWYVPMLAEQANQQRDQ